MAWRGFSEHVGIVVGVSSTSEPREPSLDRSDQPIEQGIERNRPDGAGDEGVDRLVGQNAQLPADGGEDEGKLANLGE